jgi:histidine phosphotransfer protein HptB
MNSSRTFSGVADNRAIYRGSWTPHPALLEALAGDEGCLDELIDAFKTDTEIRLQRLTVALAGADVHNMRREAHAVKGSARQVGAETLADVCEQVETAPDSMPIPFLAGLVEKIQQLYVEVAAAMESYQACRS